jgi:hypothetical protein
MRKPIIHMSFHSSVKDWTYAQFVERYKDQLTEDEIKYFATSLGLVSEPAAGILPAPVNVEDLVPPGRVKKLRNQIISKDKTEGGE